MVTDPRITMRVLHNVLDSQEIRMVRKRYVRGRNGEPSQAEQNPLDVFLWNEFRQMLNEEMHRSVVGDFQPQGLRPKALGYRPDFTIIDEVM